MNTSNIATTATPTDNTSATIWKRRETSKYRAMHTATNEYPNGASSSLFLNV